MIAINNMFGTIMALNELKAMGIKSCAIIRMADYSGGYKDCLRFSKDEDEDWWACLEPFCYVEWTGKVADLYRDWPSMNSHREPFHEEPMDEDIDLFAEIVAYIQESKR